MKDLAKRKKESHFSFLDPAAILQAAIDKLELLTKQDHSDLDVEEDGKIVATIENSLERFISRAYRFITAIFSDQIRQEQEKKLSQIKEEILNARDIIQSHSALIEKLKQGDLARQKLAQRALEIIKDYNLTVTQISNEPRISIKKQLLLDEEIKGKQIQLPLAVSVKYDSHPAHKTFKELSQTFQNNPEKKGSTPKHKKSMQVMVDAFRMKAVRLIHTHLGQPFIPDILQLVKKSRIEIEEDDNEIAMHQVVELAPGSILTLMGSFEKCSTESKLMSIPIVKPDSFRLTSQFVQTGFPYPSQHAGWSLNNTLVDAEPIRLDQVPLFQHIDQRKRGLAQSLLFDSTSMAKARQLAFLEKNIFDHQASTLIPLHRELHQALAEAANAEGQLDAILEAFYQFVQSSPSPFDLINQTQQRLIHLFLLNPAQKIQEEWLESGSLLLRTGSYQEKSMAASALLKQAQAEALLHRDDHVVNRYIQAVGQLIGPAAHSIILQYMSEKIGFAPPMLNDFERKLQICAFQQLLSFLEIMEKEQVEESQNQLVNKLTSSITILRTPNLEQLNTLTADIVRELEGYFNLRFYTHHKK